MVRPLCSGPVAFRPSCPPPASFHWASVASCLSRHHANLSQGLGICQSYAYALPSERHFLTWNNSSELSLLAGHSWEGPQYGSLQHRQETEA